MHPSRDYHMQRVWLVSMWGSGGLFAACMLFGIVWARFTIPDYSKAHVPVQVLAALAQTTALILASAMDRYEAHTRNRPVHVTERAMRLFAAFGVCSLALNEAAFRV